MEMSRRAVLPTLMAFAAGCCSPLAPRGPPTPPRSRPTLPVTIDGVEKRVGIDEALSLLKVPSASIALIDRGEIAFARAYGAGATPATIYQAASLSKFVAAVGAMRLVDRGQAQARRGRQRPPHLLAGARQQLRRNA